ncbi:response regulator [Aeromicrobium sp.]|uniref:response regulator n=1 Tax=Aeromicrobium sp. TaxID=1871063 RepID=UPI003C4D862F
MRVVIGEDNALLRDGLTRLLEANDFDVVAAAEHADDLAEALRDTDADVAVVDVRMPPTFTDEGLRVAIETRAARPGFPVLVLSQYVEQLYARELLSSGEGAVGYLLKDRVADVSAFVDAVRTVAGGGTVLDPEVVSTLLTRRQADTPLQRLTEREREVLALMAEGRSNTAIASSLFVTDKAIGKHTSNIFAKLDLPPHDDDNRRVLAVVAYLQQPDGQE